MKYLETARALSAMSAPTYDALVRGLVFIAEVDDVHPAFDEAAVADQLSVLTLAAAFAVEPEWIAATVVELRRNPEAEVA